MKVYRPHVKKTAPEDAIAAQKRARLDQLRRSIAANEPGSMPSFEREITLIEHDLTSRGRFTLMVQPGNEHPEVDEWFSTIHGTPSYGGGTVRHPRTIKVVFVDGAAEVDERLGRYLVEHEGCFRKPQEPTVMA
jgi:hypothetical protein